MNGGYNRTISADRGNPIAGRGAWSGDSEGFIATTVDLPFSLYLTKLRWRMASDNSGSNEGWRVDDVNVYECHFAGTPTATPTIPPSPTPTATPTVSPSPTPTATATATPTAIPRPTPPPRPRPTQRLIRRRSGLEANPQSFCQRVEDNAFHLGCECQGGSASLKMMARPIRRRRKLKQNRQRPWISAVDPIGRFAAWRINAA